MGKRKTIPVSFDALNRKWVYCSLKGQNIVLGDKFTDYLYQGADYKYYLANWDGVKELPWKSFCFREFYGHQGNFCVGKRGDGYFDVVTPAGRSYIPQRHCYLTAVEGIRGILILGWNEEFKAFQVLFRGEVTRMLPYMNAVIVNQNEQYNLQIFEDNDLKTSIVSSNLQIENRVIKISGCVFTTEVGKELILDSKCFAREVEEVASPKITNVQKKKEPEGWFEKLVAWLT